MRRTLILQVKDTSGLPEAAFWDIKTKDGSDASDDVLFAKAKEAGVLSTKDEDIRSLRELITYGLKGLSAYSKHANVLLSDDPEIDAFLQRALAATLDDSLTADDLVALTLETGGMTNMVFLHAFRELPIMGPIAFLLDFFLVGGLAKKAAFRIVDPEKDNPFHLVLAISAVSVLLMCPLMSLAATLLFKHAGVQVIAVWFETTAKNFPSIIPNTFSHTYFLISSSV